MRAVRPGATEHGPQGRAQCRDWAGGRMRHGTGLAAAGGDLTSLRYGEIMGLRRKDFALRDRKVKIDRAHIQPDTGPKFDGDPKAHSGRTVSLPAFLVPEVKAHLGRIRPARTRCLRVPRTEGRSPSTEQLPHHLEQGTPPSWCCASVPA